MRSSSREEPRMAKNFFISPSLDNKTLKTDNSPRTFPLDTSWILFLLVSVIDHDHQLINHWLDWIVKEEKRSSSSANKKQIIRSSAVINLHIQIVSALTEEDLDWGISDHRLNSRELRWNLINLLFKRRRAKRTDRFNNFSNARFGQILILYATSSISSPLESWPPTTTSRLEHGGADEEDNQGNRWIYRIDCTGR